MKAAGVQPNVVAYASLARPFAHRGEWQEAGVDGSFAYPSEKLTVASRDGRSAFESTLHSFFLQCTLCAVPFRWKASQMICNNQA